MCVHRKNVNKNDGAKRVGFVYIKMGNLPFVLETHNFVVLRPGV